MFGKLISVVLLATSIVSHAEAQVQDTILRKTPLFVRKDALILGAFALGAAAVAPVDRALAEGLQGPATQANQLLRRSATAFRLLDVPGSFVAAAGMYGYGRVNGQRRMQSLGLHSMESILIAGTFGAGIKLVAGRARPYVDIHNPSDFQLFRGFADDKYRSFPSGHTITAFAFASTFTREVQFWRPHSAFLIGSVMYGGATLMGLSRMYNNQHWASDVLAGAGIGTLIGLKVVKYTHSNPDNHFDRQLIRGKKSQLQPVPIVFSFQF